MPIFTVYSICRQVNGASRRAEDQTVLIGGTVYRDTAHRMIDQALADVRCEEVRLVISPETEAMRRNLLAYHAACRDAGISYPQSPPEPGDS